MKAAMKKLATLDIQNLDNKVRISAQNPDGTFERLKIPKGIQSVVILNIPSYGGGRKLWSSSHKYDKCDMSVNYSQLKVSRFSKSWDRPKFKRQFSLKLEDFFSLLKHFMILPDGFLKVVVSEFIKYCTCKHFSSF